MCFVQLFRIIRLIITIEDPLVDNVLCAVNQKTYFVEHMDHCGAMKTFHQRTKFQRAPDS